MSGIHTWSSGSPKGLAPVMSSVAHTVYLLGSGWLHSTAAAFLAGCPWYWHLRNCWSLLLQLDCAFTTNKPSSWWQASTSLHDPFSPGPSPATEAAPSLMASPGLSQCQASAALKIANGPDRVFNLPSGIPQARPPSSELLLTFLSSYRTAHQALNNDFSNPKFQSPSTILSKTWSCLSQH